MAQISLLLALVMATAGPGLVKAYQKMGSNECHGETCLPGQYCSDAAMHEGCRNCTHLNLWCPDVASLEKRFPQCAYVCELKDGQEKIATLQAEVKTLTDEKQSLTQNLTQVINAALLTKQTLQEREGDLNDTRKTLTKALDNNANLKKITENERNRSMTLKQKYLQETEALKVTSSKLEERDQRLKDAENQITALICGLVGAVFVLLVIIAAVGVCLCGAKRENKVLEEKIINGEKEPVSTASSTSGRLGRLGTLCPCLLWTKGRAPPVRYVAQPEADPTSSPMLPDTISSPGNDDGTDSGNNTGSNSTDSSQQNIMVAPNGLRTEHEKTDAEDFMNGPHNV